MSHRVVPSSPAFLGPPGTRRRARLLTALLVAGILAAMLPSLSTTLDDLDPYNFAFGVRDFDPGRHQPHPPGYPIYIGLAKVSTAVIGAIWPEPPSGPAAGQQVAARGLAVWSALAGALSVVPLFALFRRLVPASDIQGATGTAALGFRAGKASTIGLTVTDAVAAGAVALTVTSPLFWITSLRPLSDVPGLVAAVVAQVLILRARGVSLAGSGEIAGGARAWAWAGLVTALAIGLRSQAMWLALPLFGVALLAPIRAGARGAVKGAGAGLAIGGVAWVVPLIVGSGGFSAYLAALGSQGAEDFAGVDMLFREPTLRQVAMVLWHTFVSPWAHEALAGVVMSLSVIGTIWLARRRPAALGWFAVAFGPYAVFHLLFHEAVTTRYALPLVLPVACLASCGTWVIARRLQPAVALVLVAVSLSIAVPAGIAYTAEGSPIERAITAMASRAAAYDPRPVLAMHERIDRDSRRAFQWMIGDRPFWSARLPLAPGEEVRQIVTAWAAGERRPIWFLADPLRTDLALIDPVGRRLAGDFRWSFDADSLAGHTRPGRVLWYELLSPGWIVGRGWALTPPLAGADERDGKGPSREPAQAWVRRRQGAAVLMVGGRDLGGSGGTPSRLSLSIDGRLVAAFPAENGLGFFLRFVPLSPGTLAGDGDYARLSASATAADGSGRPTRVAIEQFDLQDEERVVVGFDRGWHEPEYNPETGRSWRWTSETASLRVHPGGGDLVVRLSGESPLRYFDRAPTITVRAGRREFHRAAPEGDFTFEVAIPASALAETDHLVSLTTDATFVPDEREGNGDRRRLGLRIFEVSVTGSRR